MSVKALYALQNGLVGFEKTGLFYGERSAERVQIPVTCYLIRAGDASILFDTGFSPRAVPGLMRNDPLARFTEADLLIHRLDSIGLEPGDVDIVVLSIYTMTTPAGRISLTSPSWWSSRTSIPTRAIRRRSSPRSTTGRTSTCRNTSGGCSMGMLSSCPA